MVTHLNKLVIGNERYLATFDGATYDPNVIELPAGFYIRALAKTKEFVVAETYKGSNLRESEAAKRFYWAGYSPKHDDSTDITIGACNALSTINNQLVGIYGHKGALYVNDNLDQIYNEVPKLTRGTYVEVYPGAISEYEGRALIGYAGVTDDTTGFEQGVYEFGKQDSKLPAVLNFPYIISTGNTQATNQKIGLVKVFGKDIYIGWRDDTSYGLDKIALGDGALASGAVWESLIFDNGSPDNEMEALFIKINFVALTTGQSVTPKYKLNRATSFTAGTAASTVGDTEVRLDINTRCNEAEWGFNLASSSNTFPKITSVKFVYNDFREEGEA
jgi:hypothetical protein